MFKNLSNMGNLIKQAQQMQQKMTDIQAEAEHKLVEGRSGGDMVVVTMNGQGKVLKIALNDNIIKTDEKDILEDLIVAAVNDARQKSDQVMKDEMEKVTGGMNLPAGFKLPF
jgi:DNA-binding YbaB/EbfC family protein